IADYVYVGDLQGNMWKFDVTNSNPASWGAPLNLFTATDSVPNPQPITSSVEVTRHPNGGFMVLFGTGQYLQTADITSPYKTQSFYGIWDKNDGTTVNRSQLQEQTVLGEVSSNGLDYRITSSNAVDYTSKLGWYMDFPSSDTTGERDVFNPVLRFGRIIFTTLIPLNTACDGGGTSWLMELDAITGRRLSTTPFDVNNDGVFTTADALSFSGSSYYVSGRKSTVGITNTPTVIGGDPTTAAGKKIEYKITSGSSGSTESIKENAAGVSGRLNWREILKD
ncbi:MAG: pilus assembly protein, partial [Pyrinomonadaceae bacterium]